MILKDYSKFIKLAMIITTLGSVAITSINKKSAISANALELNKYDIVNPEIYYENISNDASGALLRGQLYNLMMNTHNTYTTYDNLREAFKATDVNPNNSGQVELFYTGEYRDFTGSFTGSINREHVWPNSKGVGKDGPGADVHHLRPCDVTVNSNRGSLGYGPGGYTPNDNYKGIAARIIFYVGMHYGPESNYQLQIVESVGGSASSFGSLSSLLDWNKRFPVQSSEIRRNNAVQKIQGNRNPFIDEPDYACRIWGDTNASTREICGSTTIETDLEVTNVINLISIIGTVNANSESKIIAAENAYANLTLDQKAKVTNYQTLLNARETFNNLGTVTPPIQADEILFNFENEYSGASYAASVTKDLINESIVTQGIDSIVESVAAQGYARTKMNYGLTLGTSNNIGGLTLNFQDTLPIKRVEITGITYSSSSSSNITLDNNIGVGTLGNSLTNRGTIYWDFGDGENFNDLTFSSVYGTDGRSTILTLKLLLAQKENPVIQELISLINSIDIENITLEDDELVDYALSLYNSLSSDEKLLVTNSNVLLNAADIISSLLHDIGLSNAVVGLIASLLPVTLESRLAIEEAENAYNSLTQDQKNNVFNYSTLTQARHIYDELKAQVVIDFINNLGEITLSSKLKLDEAQNAYDSLENANQRSLVTNYANLGLKQLTYNDLLVTTSLVSSLENAIWSNTDVSSSPHAITESDRSYGLSSGKLENGKTYLGADASNVNKLAFNEENGFAGLESTLNGTYTYYAGLMMLDFAFSRPTAITFSWSDVTTTFEASLLASYDGGISWDTIANLNNITHGGSISWNSVQNKSMKNLNNANEYNCAQYAIVVGSNAPGYMENLVVAASFEGRQFDTDSALDTLIALVESADTCSDFINSLDLGLMYDQLELEDKLIFDNHIGLDGVNVKTKLDYMIYLYLHGESIGSKSTSLLDTIKHNQTLILMSSLAIISLLVITYIQKRKTAIADC